MRSLVTLWQDERALRKATLIQALLVTLMKTQKASL
ncbi:hypothetical protein PEC301879_31900 [Pectobacterium carotovorum subsp. carotovorum]|nr:hypothetical protein PEC301879_31900 [Pectobacterium carotovorum subsp. carotovorum]